MKSKRKIVKVVICAAVLLVIAGASTAVIASRNSEPAEPPKLAKADFKEEKPSGPEIAQHKVAPGLPRTLTINDISLSAARILPVGIDPDGALGAPDSIYDVGWYKDSAQPGSGSGAVLLDGHVSGVNDPNAVFSRLKELTPGARITVEKGDGSTITYVVRETETQPIEKVDMAKMMRSIDSKREGLNIITCGGKYDYNRQLYKDRVMVYAVRQDS